MEVDAYNGILAEYTYYPGADRPHGMRRGGVQYYYAQDAEGNVRGLISTAGAVVASYEYSPQGALVGSTGSVVNPYRYKGREWDAEAGLYFMRARYYDPTVGRFVSEDPIGLAGGLSLYAFAGGDPVNYSDPSGLAPCSLELLATGDWYSRETADGWSCVSTQTLQTVTVSAGGGRVFIPYLFRRGAGAGPAYSPGSGGSGASSGNPNYGTSVAKCNAPVAEFVFGGSAIAHTILATLGVGVEAGFNSAGQFFLRPYGQLGLGLGLFVGVGLYTLEGELGHPTSRVGPEAGT